MLNSGILSSIWQTARTMRRQWRVPCPWCATHGLKVTLRSGVTPRGYVLRCWQCGGEYVDREGGFRRVWPTADGGVS